MSSFDEKIKEECIRRGVSRLCHFTPSRKLAHIVAGQTGILATSSLEQKERHVFDPTDLKRLDGHKSHICCSIEYPNAYYFSKTRSSENLFKDWVILLIKPYYLWQPRALFCPRNAAAGCGRYVNEGMEGFQLLFKDKVEGTNERIFYRHAKHLPSCPTDNQAEVLIPDCIKLSDITGVVVRNEAQAKNELCRWRMLKIEIAFDLYIAPSFYDAKMLSNAIRFGERPVEKKYFNGAINE